MGEALSLAECHRLIDEGRVSDGLAGLRAALTLDAEDPVLLNAVAGALQGMSRHAEALASYRAALVSAPRPLAWRIASNYLTSLHYAGGIPAPQLRAEAAALGGQFGAADLLVPLLADGEPLRIGFVSGDLADHPVGLLLLPLILFLDNRRFTPLLFATGGRDDSTAAALKRFAPWHDVTSMDHGALLARLRAERIDILVDLSGHTAGNRLPVFARRAAPLQVSWLGYFGTTGLPAMDCVLMDEWTVPASQEGHFTEEVLRMPHHRWCYNPVGFAPDVSPPPCLARGHVTFGSFNNTGKYSEGLFEVWARILAAVPGSRLVLKWKTFADAQYCDWVRARFEALGIGRDRLDLRPRSFHLHVLEQYADVDIALDPFPFNGGYTSCESLWMGLPVITMAGDRAVARQSLGLIGALGRPDWLQAWVTDNVEGYIQRAVALAADPAELAHIRGALRPAMKASPLMDGRRFAKDFENVLAARWQRLLIEKKRL